MELDIISTDLEKVTSSEWYNQSSTSQPTHHNNTNETSRFTRDEDVAVIEVAVTATILFLAIAGNSFVILSLGIKRKQLSRMHLMILHLSLADLFVAFFNVLPQLIWDVTYRFQGGAFLCVVIKYLQVVAMYASSYVLLATAVDRYYAICRPFLSQSWTAKQAHILVIIAWTASLLFSLPQMFIFSYRELEPPGSAVYDCWADFQPEWTLAAYITWMTTSIFIVPTCLLGLLYGQITWVVWKAGRLEQKILPARFTALGQRQDSIYRSRNEAATDFQSPPYNSVKCDEAMIGQLKDDRAFFDCRVSEAEPVQNVVLDKECVCKFGNYGKIARARSLVEFTAAGTGASDNAAQDQRFASKTHLSDCLNHKLPGPHLTQLEHQCSFEDQHTSSVTNLTGVFQSAADNSNKKCQHRSGAPANPSAQSFAHPGLIMESVKMRKNCNETNLDKHNQRQYRDLIVSCDFSRCSHKSESCNVLNEPILETGKRDGVGNDVTNASLDAHPFFSRPTQKETMKDGSKYCLDSAPDNDLQILLVEGEVSNLFRDDVSCPLLDVCVGNDMTPINNISRVNSNIDLVLEEKNTKYLFDSVNYMTVEELCPRNELCRIKRANFAYLRHSACDPAIESQNYFLKQDRGNLCSHSCNSLMAGSHLHAGYDSIQSCTDNKTGNAGTVCTQHYSKATSDINLKELVISKQHDTFDGDHQSCTEDTVSTLGSLTSLKLFDATESSRPELSISSEEMTCRYALLTSANLAHSCTLSAGCGSQTQQDGLCSSGVTSKSLLSQGDPGHPWERSSPVCNVTASMGGSSDALNCVPGDQRRRSLQPGKFSISRAKLKTIKLTLTVVICYIVCWAPFFIGQMWAAYDINAPYDGPFFSIIMLLASVNSCTNPWIYTIFSNTICQKTRDIFGTPCRCFAACWKETRSYWSGKSAAPSAYHQTSHVARKNQTILEKNSFSTLG